MEQKKQTAT